MRILSQVSAMGNKAVEILKMSTRKGVALCAMTKYKCKMCGKESMHNNSNVPMLCSDCFEEVHLDWIDKISYKEFQKLSAEVLGIVKDNEKMIYEKKCAWYKRQGWDKPVMPEFLEEGGSSDDDR